jgi:tetratricopeptide (TPR) repeat protein
MFTGLTTVQHFDWIGIFFPYSHSGLYYRPMIAVSFFIDRFLWNLDPEVMHFENILLHLTSTLLVFLIARLIISKTSKLPLFAALVFAVHPIATESVNWISGRTDLLAVMFVLASLYSVLCFRDSRQIWWLVSSVITLIIGILAKETAIGFIPALVFILTSKSEVDSKITNELHIHRQSLTLFFAVGIFSLATALLLSNYYLSLFFVISYFFYLLWCRREHVHGALLQKYFLLFSGCIIFLWAFFWGIRKLAFSSQSPHIQRTFGLLFADINYTLALFFRAVGFYAKKFIYPFPLSFVIRDVSPFYTLFGIILLCLVVVLLIRRKLPDALVIAGFCMIAPVLPLTFESIAWTSYAERYVYQAAPFWILALAGYAASAGFDHLSLRMHKWCLAGLSLLIIVIAALTFQRNLVWQTNIALFKDSVEKTPDYKPVRGLYMSALFEKGLTDEALHQYQIAQSLQTIQLKYSPNYDLFYARLLIAKMQFIEAEQELDRINKKMDGKEPEVYGTYLELAPRILLKTDVASEKMRITEKIAVSYDKWYELTKNPMILYRKGQFMLSLNKKREAGNLFARAATAFPENNFYRSFSEKLARKLVDRL